jgi:hypothetical protein
MSDRYYRRTSGRCIRCRVAFAPGQVVTVVRERIAYGISYGLGADMCLGHSVEWVTVCESCATAVEQANACHECRCAGCSQPMLTPSMGHEVCSSRCARRYMRRLKSERKKAYCETCNQLFVPKRTDANYCSSACRQWAYRRRKASWRGGGMLAKVVQRGREPRRLSFAKNRGPTRILVQNPNTTMERP